MIAQLIFGLLLACSLFAQTQVELTQQVKGELPPVKGGTGVSSCLENEGLIWQSGEFACSALASGPHAPTHQDGGADEVATVTPSANAIPKSNADSTLSDGWLPGTISRDITWTGSQTFKQANGILLSTEFDWSQDPGTSLALGANTVTLTPCAAGVNGTNSDHYIYVDDANNALDESVLITGGTCTSEAASGTVQFTTSNSHTSGNYNLRSATAGIQEAIWYTDSVDPGVIGGRIYTPCGTHDVFAQITFGDGTATKAATGTESAVHHFASWEGCGPGRERTADPHATTIRWQGTAGTMVKLAGKLEGVRIAGTHLWGNDGAAGVTAPDTILEIAGCRRCVFRELMISDSALASTGIDIYGGSNQNHFEHIAVDNRSPGSGGSGIIVCNSDTFCTQNIFDDIHIWHEDNEPNYYGLFVGYSDNSQFRNILSFGSDRTVSTVTCATPIQFDIAQNHGLTTGDTLRAYGKGTCSGGGLIDANYTITVVDPDSFTLDGTSASGTHSGLTTRYGGPGSNLHLDCSKKNLFPHNNAFYHIAPVFARTTVNSPTTCGSNLFIDFAHGDNEDLNIFANVVGDTKPDPAAGFINPNIQTSTDFWHIAGKFQFVTEADAADPYAMFWNNTGRVMLGGAIGESTSPSSVLHLRDSTGGAASGVAWDNTNEILNASFVSNVSNANFALSYVGSGGNDLVIESDGDVQIAQSGGRVSVSGASVPTDVSLRAADGIDPGDVTQANLPNTGIVYCTSCNADATCTSGGSGAWARCRSSSCTCNW